MSNVKTHGDETYLEPINGTHNASFSTLLQSSTEGLFTSFRRFTNPITRNVDLSINMQVDQLKKSSDSNL